MRSSLREPLTLAAFVAAATLFSPAATLAGDDNSGDGRKIMTKEAGSWIGHTGSLIRGLVQRQV